MQQNSIDVRMSQKLSLFIIAFRKFIYSQEISLEGYFRTNPLYLPNKITRLDFNRMVELVNQTGFSFKPLELFVELKKNADLIDFQYFKVLYVKMAKMSSISQSKQPRMTLTQEREVKEDMAEDRRRQGKVGFDKLLRFVNSEDPEKLFKAFGKSKIGYISKNEFDSMMSMSSVPELKNKEVRSYLIAELYNNIQCMSKSDFFRLLFVTPQKPKQVEQNYMISTMHKSLEKFYTTQTSKSHSISVEKDKKSSNPQLNLSSTPKIQTKIRNISELQPIKIVERDSISRDRNRFTSELVRSQEKQKPITSLKDRYKQREQDKIRQIEQKRQYEQIKKREEQKGIQKRRQQQQKQKERERQKIVDLEKKKQAERQRKKIEKQLKEEQQRERERLQKQFMEKERHKQAERRKFVDQEKQKFNELLKIRQIDPLERVKKSLVQKAQKNISANKSSIFSKNFNSLISSSIEKTNKTQSSEPIPAPVQKIGLSFPKYSKESYNKNDLILAKQYYRKAKVQTEDLPFLQELEMLLYNKIVYQDTNNPEVSKFQYTDSNQLFGGKMYQLIACKEGKEKTAVIQPRNIEQGCLGNCYFVSAVSSIANKYPSFFLNVFLFNANPASYYAVKIFIDGTWIIIKTDGRLPNIYNKPAFAKSKEPEIWMSLLEKCFAKYHGSYNSIVSGTSSEAYQVLSGASSGRIFCEKQTSQESIAQIKQAQAKGYPMNTAGNSFMKSLSQTELENLGLITNHMYSLLGIYSHDKEHLVKLRNPWGNKPWKGEWSYGSAKWTPKLKKQYNYEEDFNDGSFFMSFSDFLKYYEDINYCKMNPAFLHTSLMMVNNKKKSNYVEMKVKTKGAYQIFIYQQGKRGMKKQEVEYSNSRIIILKKQENGSMIYIGSQSKRLSQQVNYECLLEPGTYFISAKVAWNTWDEHECCLTVYGTDIVALKLTDRSIAAQFKNDMIASYAEQRRQKAEKSNYEAYKEPKIITYTHYSLSEGLGFLKIENGSAKTFESVFQFNLKGMKIIKPKSSPYKVRLQPGEKDIIGFITSPSSISYQEKQSQIKFI